MKQLVLATAAAFTLAGCAGPSYLLGGVKYNSTAAFMQASDEMGKRILAQVTPLPRPLTTKKLVASFPSVEAQMSELVRRYVETYGMPPTAGMVEQATALAQNNLNMNRNSYEAVAKRGIYREVSIIDSKTMVNSMEPGPDYDVLYLTEGGVGTGQMFYASAKHGKQAFAYDRSGTTPESRTNSLIEAVQALAMRE